MLKVILTIYLLGCILSLLLYVVCAIAFRDDTNLRKMSKRDLAIDIILMVALSWVSVAVESCWLKEEIKKHI